MLKRLVLFISLVLLLSSVVSIADAKTQSFDPPFPRLPAHNPKSAPNLTPGDGDRGFNILNVSNNVTGVTASFSMFNSNFTLSAQSPDREQTYYTPTLLPPNNSCLEVTAVHWRHIGQNFTDHAVGFYDWCGDGEGGDGTVGWQNFYYATASFISTYTNVGTYPAPHGTDRYLPIKVEKYLNHGVPCSEGFLFNYTTFAYESKSLSCGVRKFNQPTGWTMFEFYETNVQPGAVCFGPLGPYNKVATDDIFIRVGTGSYTALTNAMHGTDVVPYYDECWGTPINGHKYTYTTISPKGWLVTWS